MGKKRVQVFGNFEAEEQERQKKAIARQQKKLREGKDLSKAEQKAAELLKFQSHINLDEDQQSSTDPYAAMRAEMNRMKADKNKGTTSVSPDATNATSTTDPQKARRIHIRSTRYTNLKSNNPRTKMHAPKDAISQIKQISYSKFAGTVELHVNLRKKESFTNTTIDTPHPAGKSKKAVYLTDDIVQQLQNKNIDFDVLFASADQMKQLVPFAKLLGPRGLMPNPKNGTLTPDPVKAANGYKATSHTIKTEPKSPLIHTTIGKTNMEVDALLANLEMILKTVNTSNIISAYLAATMSPSLRIDLSQL